MKTSTYHYNIERKDRRDYIKKTVGIGKEICSMRYTSPTSKKESLNVLTDTGVIIVYNNEWIPVTVFIGNIRQTTAIYRKATGEKLVPPSLFKKFQIADYYSELQPK